MMEWLSSFTTAEESWQLNLASYQATLCDLHNGYGFDLRIDVECKVVSLVESGCRRVARSPDMGPLSASSSSSSSRRDDGGGGGRKKRKKRQKKKEVSPQQRCRRISLLTAHDPRSSQCFVFTTNRTSLQECLEAFIRHLRQHHVLMEANLQPPHPLFTDYEIRILRVLWNTFRPLAQHLKNVVMPAPTTPPGLAPVLLSDLTTKQKTPSFAARRAACTHLTVQRLYDVATCDICHLKGGCGYVYVCTQDHGEPFSLEAQRSFDEQWSEEAFHGDHATAPGALSPTTKLALWIEEAIARGEYTTEQVEKLREQKRRVVEVTQTSLQRYKEEEDARQQSLSGHYGQVQTTSDHPLSNRSTASKASTPSSSSSNTLSSQTEASLDTNPHLPFPLIHSVDNTTVTLQQAVPSPAALSKGSTASPPATTSKKRKSASDGPLPTPGSKSSNSLFPPCTFTACQSCRPSYRDRAWARFEDAFAIPSSHLPTLVSLKSETHGPTISPAYLLKTIGLKEPPSPKIPPAPPNSPYVVPLPDGNTYVPANRSAWEEGTDITTTSPLGRPSLRRSGLRSSIRNRVKGWIERRETPPPVPVHAQPPLPDTRAAQEGEDDDDVLYLAAQTKMPGESDSESSLHGEGAGAFDVEKAGVQKGGVFDGTRNHMNGTSDDMNSAVSNKEPKGKSKQIEIDTEFEDIDITDTAIEEKAVAFTEEAAETKAFDLVVSV